MLVVCDTFSDEEYPVFVQPNEQIIKTIRHYHGVNMQHIREVYHLSLSLRSQLNESRAWHIRKHKKRHYVCHRDDTTRCHREHLNNSVTIHAKGTAYGTC